MSTLYVRFRSVYDFLTYQILKFLSLYSQLNVVLGSFQQLVSWCILTIPARVKLLARTIIRYTHSPTVFGNSRVIRDSSFHMIEVPYPHVQIIIPIICELEVGHGDFVLYHDLRDQFRA